MADEPRPAELVLADAAVRFTEDTPLVEVDQLLAEVAEAHLTNLGEDTVLREIHRRCHQSLGALRLRVAGMKKEFREEIRRAQATANGGMNGHAVALPKRRAGLEVVDATAPAYSDEGLASRFIEQFAGQAKHVAAWGKWLFWDGKRWEIDEVLRALDESRRLCRIASAEVDEMHANAIASADKISSVLKLARSDKRIGVMVETLDPDFWVLNTPSGIIDLRTSNLTDHNPDACCTKITAVGPGGECPRWRQFLCEITGGDAELEAFLQRVAGYCLTGDTRDHAIFFCYGTGANGKGVFLNTLSKILRDYATTAPMETFTVSQVEQHPTELAGLRGARLVTAQETEQGHRWAEAKIKRLTGGDPIKARFMMQDFFEYTPQFKLLIAGNHRPSLRNVDEALRRRFHMIPFTVTIPEDQRDRELAEKLVPEWPGILLWMIEGCLDWQRVGLDPPAAVRTATNDYLSAEDALNLWIDECCDVGPYEHDTLSALFVSWQKWAERAGEYVGSRKKLAQALQDRGYSQHRHPETKAAVFDGLQVAWEQPV